MSSSIFLKIQSVYYNSINFIIHLVSNIWTSYQKIPKVMKADLQVLGAAFFFGIGFLGQRTVSVNGLGVMACNTYRFGLSAIMLASMLPFKTHPTLKSLFPDDSPQIHGNTDNFDTADDDSHIDDKITRPVSTTVVISKLFGSNIASSISSASKTVIFWGVLLGIINFGGSGFQQWGISLTSASKCAFIAGFDLFLTPIFSLFIPTLKANAKPKPSTWLAVCVSLVGLFLLSDVSFAEFGYMGMGESLSLISTIFWTLHIIYTDVAMTRVDGISMMCIQLAVVAFLSLICAIITDLHELDIRIFFKFLPWLLFLAVVEGLGCTLMALGQVYSPPAHVTLILGLEGVFTSFFSYIFLGETLSWGEIFGGVLMLTSTIIVKVGCGAHEKPIGNLCGCLDFFPQFCVSSISKSSHTNGHGSHGHGDNLESASFRSMHIGTSVGTVSSTVSGNVSPHSTAGMSLLPLKSNITCPSSSSVAGESVSHLLLHHLHSNGHDSSDDIESQVK